MQRRRFYRPGYVIRGGRWFSDGCDRGPVQFSGDVPYTQLGESAHPLGLFEPGLRVKGVRYTEGESNRQRSHGAARRGSTADPVDEAPEINVGFPEAVGQMTDDELEEEEQRWVKLLHNGDPAAAEVIPFIRREQNRRRR